MNEIFQFQLLQIFQHPESEFQNKCIFIIVDIQIEEIFDPSHSVIYGISVARKLRGHTLYASSRFQINRQSFDEFGIVFFVVVENRFETLGVLFENLLIFR